MQIPVLQLTLGSGVLSTVSVTLITEEGAGGQDLHLMFHPSDFGIPQSLTGVEVRDEQFMLPSALIDLLHRSWDELDNPQSLWVQLVEPFGYLALVPWERLIQANLAVSVVRLPSLTLARRRPTNSLQVAILAPVPNFRRRGTVQTRVHAARLALAATIKTQPDSAVSLLEPPTEPAEDDADLRNGFSASDLDRVVRAVLDGSPRAATTVHVVTTPWLYHELRAMWRGRPWPVRLHDPYSLIHALQQRRLRSAPVEASWLKLLSIAQGGEQADVVHLICHSNVTDTKAQLVFADPLHTKVNVASRYVSIPALMSALDRVGAWSLCLTSPPGSHTAPQLRYFACRFAELRPGPLLVTDLATDPGASDIAAGYSFLFAEAPSAPPRTGTGMIACEPHRIRGETPERSTITQQVESAPNEQPRAEVASLLADDSTPMWVAAAQRFIEQRQVELARLERDAPVGARSPEAVYVTQGIKRALVIIQEALAARAQQRPGEEL